MQGCRLQPPYDPDLFVADVSDTNLALLNKFSVFDHHLLVVTCRFEEQETLLDIADFQALSASGRAHISGAGFRTALRRSKDATSSSCRAANVLLGTKIRWVRSKMSLCQLRIHSQWKKAKAP